MASFGKDCLLNAGELARGRLFGFLLAVFAATACASATPPAPPYRVTGPEQSACLRPVPLLTFAQLGRPYRELSHLSATCPYISPNTCERTLLARGCELGADAVVLTSSLPFRPHTTSTVKAQLADEAVAVRFEPLPP